MELTNFWWLLVWVFIGGYVLNYYMPKETFIVAGKKEEKWKLGPAMALMIPYIIWAGFRNDSFGDTIAYRNAFHMMPITLDDLPAYIETISKDTGFYVFSAFIKILFTNSDVIYFLILATIQITCIVIVLRKYSCDYWLSVFLFIASTEYIGWMHNGIRQFTAVTLIYASTDLWVRKKYIPLLGVILFASTIHGSALLMMPLVFIIQGKAWNKRTVLCIVASIMVLFFVERFTGILDRLLSDTQYMNAVTEWKTGNDDGTNPIRVLICAIPMLLSIIGLRTIKNENHPIINIATNASIVTTGLYLISMVTSGIFMGRLPIYMSLYSLCILLPWEIKNLFKPSSSRVVELSVIAFYIIFFYYQMHFAWGLL